MSQKRIREGDCKMDDSLIQIETLRNENATLTRENECLKRENSRLEEENAGLKQARVKDAERAAQFEAKNSELEEGMKLLQESMMIRKQTPTTTSVKDDTSSRSKDSGAETDSGFSGGRPIGSSSKLGSPATVISSKSSANKRARHLSSTPSSAASLRMSLHSDVTGPIKREPPVFSNPPSLPPPPNASSVSDIPFPSTCPAPTSSKHAITPDASQSTVDSQQQPVEMKPAPPDDDDNGLIVLDSEEEEDDVIIMPSEDSEKTRRRTLERAARLDENNRNIVMRGNRANGEQKQTILNFMAGTWKTSKGNAERAIPTQTILVSEGNESLKMADGNPRVVFVETYMNLNYATGKLLVSKKWKPI